MKVLLVTIVTSLLLPVSAFAQTIYACLGHNAVEGLVLNAHQCRHGTTPQPLNTSSQSNAAPSTIQTVCNTGTYQSPNNALEVEADCPSGTFALGGGWQGSDRQFDRITPVESSPVLNANGQAVGWSAFTYASDLMDTTAPQSVEVCVTCE